MSAAKVAKGQEWKPKRGAEWAHVVEVDPNDESATVRKFLPDDGHHHRLVSMKTKTLTSDYTLVK